MPAIHPIDCGSRRQRPLMRVLMIAGDVLVGSAVIGAFVLMIGWCLFAGALT